ncbi:MAG: hypothetical protein AAF228_06625 [Pseudomonadota bacterium]
MNNRRYKCGEGRHQLSLLPPSLEDYVHPDNALRAIEVYVDTLNLADLGFCYADAASGAGQSPYDPAILLKLYLYGYLIPTFIDYQALCGPGNILHQPIYMHNCGRYPTC